MITFRRQHQLEYIGQQLTNCATLDVQHIQDVLFELTALKLQCDHWKTVAKGAIK